MSISIIMPGHNNWYSITTAPNDFSINFKPIGFQKLSVIEAADYTAKLISETYQNLWLSFSGGYDSEFVANTLKRNNIKFTPVIWRDALHNESDYALFWCRKNNIDPLIINRNFLNNKNKKVLELISSKVQNNSMLAAIPVELAILAEKHNANLITGTGECFCNNHYPLVMSDQTEFAEQDWFVEILFPEKHPGAFFTYTPEMLYSIITNIDTSLPTQEAKAKLYDLEFRPKLRPHHLTSELNFDRKQYVSVGSLKQFADMLNVNSV